MRGGGGRSRSCGGVWLAGAAAHNVSEKGNFGGEHGGGGWVLWERPEARDVTSPTEGARENILNIGLSSLQRPPSHPARPRPRPSIAGQSPASLSSTHHGRPQRCAPAAALLAARAHRSPVPIHRAQHHRAAALSRPPLHSLHAPAHYRLPSHPYVSICSSCLAASAAPSQRPPTYSAACPEPRRAAVAIIVRVAPPPTHVFKQPTTDSGSPANVPPPSLTDFFQLDWVNAPGARPEILFLRRDKPDPTNDGGRMSGSGPNTREAHVAFPGGKTEEGDEGGLYTGEHLRPPTTPARAWPGVARRRPPGGVLSFPAVLL